MMFARLATLLSALPVVAVAQGVPQADKISQRLANLQAGVICADEGLTTRPAPETISGDIHLIEHEPPFVATTRRVPAVIGIGFGVKSQSVEIPGINDVTVTITHPAMGSAAAKSQSFMTSINGTQPSLTFYQFDFDYELVTGVWQMTATQGNDVLYRTTFEVVPAQQMPELAQVCGFEELLS